ncbi:MAG TPA: hypothetical protein VFR06_07495 [Gallionellaceae bacterium]|nr:hypothetical protein [Gallionellaceae bacterium]
MLTLHRPHTAMGKPRSNKPRNKQSGVVLLITLIVLVAMTLGAIALVRSVDTTNVIAGNLSFQQAATHSADIGTEVAMQWLVANNNNTLWSSAPAFGYLANRTDPGPGQSWSDFWDASLSNSRMTVYFIGGLPTGAIPLNASSLLPSGAQFNDSAGNTVEYVIQRMCNGAAGDPMSPASLCPSAPAIANVYDKPDSLDANAIKLTLSGQYYYRITTRVTGPRNTVSFIQTIVVI